MSFKKHGEAKPSGKPIKVEDLEKGKKKKSDKKKK